MEACRAALGLALELEGGKVSSRNGPGVAAQCGLISSPHSPSNRRTVDACLTLTRQADRQARDMPDSLSRGHAPMPTSCHATHKHERESARARESGARREQRLQHDMQKVDTRQKWTRAESGHAQCSLRGAPSRREGR